MIAGGLIVLKILGIALLAAIIFIVGCACVLSGRISREEEETAEYRELFRRLYLANARRNAEAAANDHVAHDLVPTP